VIHEAMRGFTRRKFLAASIALSAGSIALSTRARLSRRTAAIGEPSPVTIVRQTGYTQDLYATVRTILAAQHLEVRGKRVVLKPNLVEFEPDRAINTHPMMVHAALEAFRSMGAADVRIAEGPGHRRGTFDLAEAAGYFGIIPGFEKIFMDLNLDDVSHIKLRDPFSALKSLYLPHTALSCDLLVSMPKMKTHHWAGATLSMKNLFGLVPGGVYGWPKNVLHWAGIPECIADLHALFPRTFALVDGIVGMEGNGPIQGVPKHAGVIVAGVDMVAVDATCCRIMGIDPLKIEYLTLARNRAGLSEAAIRQTGETINLVKTPFALLPQFASLRA
jgi:uncharacterized protein (DUF362 family)